MVKSKEVLGRASVGSGVVVTSGSHLISKGLSRQTWVNGLTGQDGFAEADTTRQTDLKEGRTSVGLGSSRVRDHFLSK